MSAWTCGVCNEALSQGTRRCPRCATPVSPPEEAPPGRDGILGDPLRGYVPPSSGSEESRPYWADLRRRRRLAAGVVGAVIVLLVGVVWATSGDRPEPRVRQTTATSADPTTDTTGTTSVPSTSGTVRPPTSFGQPPTSGPTTTSPSTGPTTSTPPVPALAERWNVRLGRMSRWGAVNGTRVVVAARSGTVVSLDAATGAVRWRRSVGEQTPNGVVLSEGIVITRAQSVTSATGEIVAIDERTGRILWRREVTSSTSVFDPPAAVGGGRVYVNARTLLALDIRTGRQLWKGPDTSEAVGAPAISGDRVILCDFDGTLKAFNATTGRSAWTSKVTRGAPVAAGDLVLVQGISPNPTLYAVDSRAGAIRWRVPIQASPLTPPARAGDTVVIPSSGDLVGVQASDGLQRWTAPDIVPNSAVASSASSVYATNFKLSILDARTGTVRTEGQLSDVSIFPALPAGDTTVVIMTDSVGGYR